MSNPEYVKIKEHIYKINTDFRVALECNQIARDTEISNTERAMAIIYKLFGEDGLNSSDSQKLLELGLKYISMSNDAKNTVENEPRKDYELDFIKCEGLIRSSFKFDYNYDPYELEYLHWYDFFNDLANLSTSDFGSCCVLNRIVSILEKDVKEIKDTKEKEKTIKAQKYIKEKYCIQKEVQLTEEQEESANELYKALGFM